METEKLESAVAQQEKLVDKLQAGLNIEEQKLVRLERQLENMEGKMLPWFNLHSVLQGGKDTHDDT